MQKIQLSNKLRTKFTFPNFCLFMIAMISLAKIIPYRAYYNHTTSMPLGIYWVDSHNTQPRLNELVMVCLSNDLYRQIAISRHYLVSSGQCNNLESMLKKIVGVPGNYISVTPAGILVNGLLVPNSAIKPHDEISRKLPSALKSGRIPQDYYLAMGESESSFDSRYFGLIPANDVIATAHKF